ncbi:ABC transporter ATP-binding protein [Sporichthya polymorpha]|uniref:ABC transporter ATP-binding protein n=1 Tax=Sporichthya polymorpha TaxID=35751 RepID=UPI000381DE4F|nr:ABC transporter ATP-binding protein [Sporichthya polymorpha]
MLELQGVEAGYGSVRALGGIDLTVQAGETVALLGRNGAGKTSTLRVASAMIRARAGSVRLDGEPLRRTTTTEDLVARGLVHVPEGRGLFPHLSVAENLEVGAHVRRLSRRQSRSAMDEAMEYFPVLRTRLRQNAGSMSGGEQQMLVVARALMAKPRLLLLDEPSFGLSPIVCESLYDTFRRLAADGLALLIVEQYVDLVATVADRAYVLDKGHVVRSGDPRDTLSGEVIEKAYLADTLEVSR